MLGIPIYLIRLETVCLVFKKLWAKKKQPLCPRLEHFFHILLYLHLQVTMITKIIAKLT